MCSSKWSTEDAAVVCREMGFSGVVSAIPDYVRPSRESNARLRDVTCSGNEDTILSCRYSDWTDQSCNPDNVVGVICEPGMVSVIQEGMY